MFLLFLPGKRGRRAALSGETLLPPPHLSMSSCIPARRVVLGPRGVSYSAHVSYLCRRYLRRPYASTCQRCSGAAAPHYFRFEARRTHIHTHKHTREMRSWGSMSCSLMSLLGSPALPLYEAWARLPHISGFSSGRSERRVRGVFYFLSFVLQLGAPALGSPALFPLHEAWARLPRALFGPRLYP